MTRRVPDQNVWTGELIEHALTFAPDPATGRLRLSYEDPQDGDWEHGLLWLRHGQDRSGQPKWKGVNTPRTRQMMAHHLCMVCTGSAVHHGRIRWVLTQDPDVTPDGNPITNVPPTCLACTPHALKVCPRLTGQARVLSVGWTTPFAVTADIYSADYGDPIPAVKVIHQANIPYTRENRHKLPFALGKQPWVALHDMRDESPVLP